MTSNSTDFDLQNFQSLVENYESAVRDITSEIDGVLSEQNAITNNIREVLNENSKLSSQLDKVYSQKAALCSETRTESDLIENLNRQLKSVLIEKENAVKLWQNAVRTIDYLESELKIYQSGTDGLVPKAKLLQLKSSYEEKLNGLEQTLSSTKKTLEDTINSTSRQLQFKEKEIGDTIKNQNNTIEIIKNLEGEILKLQQRIETGDKMRSKLEKINKIRTEQMAKLKTKAAECRTKVEEALQVAEAALKDKDAAVKRETRAKEEILRLSRMISDVVENSERKIKEETDSIRASYESKLNENFLDLKTSREEMKVRSLELENICRKCEILEKELEKFRNGSYLTDSNTTKLLMLEKNLEETFQKLLFSERQNIQIRAEKESIKSDLDQMSTYYERDINNRITDKANLQKEVGQLKMELEETKLKLEERGRIIESLNDKIATMDHGFKIKIKETNSAFEQTCKEREEVESIHKQMQSEMQAQLSSQIEINRKWRTETKNITEKLEVRIKELKSEMGKIKAENRALMERLRGSNVKIMEYKKFLELISMDVTRISHIALPPDTSESDNNKCTC